MARFKINSLIGVSLAMLMALGATKLQAQEFIGYIRHTVNPEDMVVIPDTKWVIASTDNTPGKKKPAYLYLINARSGVAEPADAKIAVTPTAGDPSCKPIGMSDLAMSGLGMRNEIDGSHQLMAVNRGKRMSIEFFNIDLSSSKPALTWNGCVIMPAKAFPNAVVPIRNGGLAVTISLDTDNTRLIDQLEKKQHTGYLLEWTRLGGFRRVPGSELPLDNGLKISPDGKFYYIAGWGGESLLRLPTSAGSGKPLLINIGVKPDNLSWSATGNLIVGGQIQSAAKIFACVASSDEICPVPFKILEVNPADLSIIRVLVNGEKMKNYAGATTGIEVGKELWVSSFRNNKIARYRLK